MIAKNYVRERIRVRAYGYGKDASSPFVVQTPHCGYVDGVVVEVVQPPEEFKSLAHTCIALVRPDDKTRKPAWYESSQMDIIDYIRPDKESRGKRNATKARKKSKDNKRKHS
jgi:hypothetical protein